MGWVEEGLGFRLAPSRDRKLIARDPCVAGCAEPPLLVWQNLLFRPFGLHEDCARQRALPPRDNIWPAAATWVCGICNSSVRGGECRRQRFRGQNPLGPFLRSAQKCPPTRLANRHCETAGQVRFRRPSMSRRHGPSRPCRRFRSAAASDWTTEESRAQTPSSRATLECRCREARIRGGTRPRQQNREPRRRIRLSMIFYN